MKKPPIMIENITHDRLTRGMRKYRIKQVGRKFYLETLDIIRHKPPRWAFWKSRVWTEELVWRICGEDGTPATMGHPGEFWRSENPILDGFDSLKDAQKQIDEFRANQVVGYFDPTEVAGYLNPKSDKTPKA